MLRMKGGHYSPDFAASSSHMSMVFCACFHTISIKHHSSFTIPLKGIQFVLLNICFHLPLFVHGIRWSKAELSETNWAVLGDQCKAATSDDKSTGTSLGEDLLEGHKTWVDSNKACGYWRSSWSIMPSTDVRMHFPYSFNRKQMVLQSHLWQYSSVLARQSVQCMVGLARSCWVSFIPLATRALMACLCCSFVCTSMIYCIELFISAQTGCECIHNSRCTWETSLSS